MKGFSGKAPPAGPSSVCYNLLTGRKTGFFYFEHKGSWSTVFKKNLELLALRL